VSVTPAFAGLSGAGLYQINVTIPAGLGSGDVSLVATVGGVQTPSNVVISLLTSQVTQAGISLLSGGGQSALPNSTFAQPLVFAVTVNQNPAPGALVTFAVASGSATVNPGSAITNSQGQVSTMVQSGSTAGAVTIIASYGAFSASVSLTVAPHGPSVTASGFTNSATTGSSNPQEGLVPCGINSVTGPGLAATIQGVLPGNSQGPLLPYTLGGVSITINGVPAPLVSVSNLNGVQQVNFQTPCEVVPGFATAVVQVNGGTTVVSGIQVLATQPGILNYTGPGNAPYGYVISALDGSLVTSSNPAHPGQTYYMEVTGLGQTTPPIVTNAPGTGNQLIPLSQVIVGVNNVAVPVTSAEYAQGEIGVYLIGFTIPANAPTGSNQPLAVEVNGVFGNPVYLPGVM
jgi:uncharacterized protein (TIGR03437 family)